MEGIIDFYNPYMYDRMLINGHRNRRYREIMTSISLQEVKKSYRSGEETTHVLKGVDLEVGRGEMLMIMGPSGSGKTTFLNLLGGIDVPDSGQVLIDGEEISSYGPQQLSNYRRRQVGFIFQFYNLIPTLNALENVELSLETINKDKTANREKAMRYLEMVGLGDRWSSFPQELSGGQQQRVAIARALSKEPRLILADEPTGNLDREREQSVMELMKDIQKKLGITFFIVSHNSRLIPFMDRIFELDAGRLQEIRG